MTDRQVFIVGTLAVVVLTALDAVAGRALQASPALSVVLSLGVAAWISYQRARAGLNRFAVVDGMVAWALYVALFILWARLLVGWNQSAPWTPSGQRVLGWAGLSLVVSFAARMVGARRAPSGGEPRSGQA